MPWSGFEVSIVSRIGTHVCRGLSVFLLGFQNCHKFPNFLHSEPYMIKTPLYLSKRLIIRWLVVREQIYTSIFAHFMNQNIANIVNSCMSKHSIVVES